MSPAVSVASAGAPDSHTLAWVGLGLGGVVVVLLAATLVLICHPPLVQCLPVGMRGCFQSIGKPEQKYVPPGAEGDAWVDAQPMIAEVNQEGQDRHGANGAGGNEPEASKGKTAGGENGVEVC